MAFRYLVLAVLVLSGSTLALAQTTLNPDISVVGDVRLFTHDNGSEPEQMEKVNITDPSMELMVSGYLNPYARADAVVAWHGEENAEIEEVYATILRGLPLAMNLRAGRYFLEFGRLNPVHEHAWSFIKRPLPHQSFFGHHGATDMAIRSSILLPTGDAFTELLAGITKGDALLRHHHHDVEEEEHLNTEEPDRYNPGFFGRLTTSIAASDHAELALGVSVLNAAYSVVEHEEADSTIEHEPEQLRAWVIGADIKYKYRPSRYSSLLIEAEGIVRSDEQADGDKLNSYGGYGYLDYRFNQKYNIGSIFEWTRVKETEHVDGEVEHTVHEHESWRVGLFTGFAPIEETSLLRLAGHWTDLEEEDGFWEVTLQFVFSLGPHQPHNF